MAIDHRSNSGWRLAMRKITPTATTIRPPEIELPLRYCLSAILGSPTLWYAGADEKFRSIAGNTTKSEIACGLVSCYGLFRWTQFRFLGINAELIAYHG